MEDNHVIKTKDVNFYYGNFRALTDITMDFEKNRVTALIGPSGCGKSTLLRLLNRMNDLIDGTRVEGEVLFEGKNMLPARRPTRPWKRGAVHGPDAGVSTAGPRA